MINNKKINFFKSPHKLGDNKKAISPLVATFLLVVFSLLLGSIIMNAGKNYVAGLVGEEKENSFVIAVKDVDTELKELQVKYLQNEITYEEYLQKEKALLGK